MPEDLLDDFNPPPGGDVSARNAWQRLIRIADSHNDPGTFTALIGWEWSSNPGGANLHRVVVSDADAERARRFEPFGFDDSPDPQALWAWLERTAAETGTRFVAIPHNSNISKILMFDQVTLRGAPMDAAYAETRRRSPEPYRPRPGYFVRSGLLNGLAVTTDIGVNPYRFGVIGSTDAHTALSSAEEPNFWGKMAYDSIPENKQGDAVTHGATGWDMAAAGLAAVWADENTRGGILDAFARRAVYATTGPRVRLRVFGGWEFEETDLARDDRVAAGYARGVPMGSELPAAPATPDAAPTFMIMASADPDSGHLDRIQMVKGWLGANGQPQERVFDVAWSGDRTPGADGALPPVGDTVDRARGTFSNSIGAPTLSAVWRDPAFAAGAPAFYYVRVLEIPTPQHSLLDALALGIEPPDEHPAVIQERAYGSAIWYQPP